MNHYKVIHINVSLPENHMSPIILGDFPRVFSKRPQVGWAQKSSDGHLDGLLRAAGPETLRRRSG